MVVCVADQRGEYVSAACTVRGMESEALAQQQEKATCLIAVWISSVAPPCSTEGKYA